MLSIRHGTNPVSAQELLKDRIAETTLENESITTENRAAVRAKEELVVQVCEWAEIRMRDGNGASHVMRNQLQNIFFNFTASSTIEYHRCVYVARPFRTKFGKIGLSHPLIIPSSLISDISTSTSLPLDILTLWTPLFAQHDTMRLECKRLRDLLHAKADMVIGLENRKLQLGARRVLRNELLYK
jgi:hypothetical protein